MGKKQIFFPRKCSFTNFLNYTREKFKFTHCPVSKRSVRISWGHPAYVCMLHQSAGFRRARRTQRGLSRVVNLQRTAIQLYVAGHWMAAICLGPVQNRTKPWTVRLCALFHGRRDCCEERANHDGDVVHGFFFMFFLIRFFFQRAVYRNRFRHTSAQTSSTPQTRDNITYLYAQTVHRFRVQTRSFQHLILS